VRAVLDKVGELPEPQREGWPWRSVGGSGAPRERFGRAGRAEPDRGPPPRQTLLLRGRRRHSVISVGAGPLRSWPRRSWPRPVALVFAARDRGAKALAGGRDREQWLDPTSGRRDLLDSVVWGGWTRGARPHRGRERGVPLACSRWPPPYGCLTAILCNGLGR